MTAQADHPRADHTRQDNCISLLEPLIKRRTRFSCIILYPLLFLALATIFWAKLQGVSRIGHM
jgi:hypothetical protein